jgi:methylamine---glutamate N-methyltransferase subunit C
MSTYKCKVCGYIHKGDAPPEECPICKQPASAFEKISDIEEIDKIEEVNKKEHGNIRVYQNENDLSYPKEYTRDDRSERYMDEIHKMAVTGKQIIGSMGTRMYIPNWDDILILGNQLNPPPWMNLLRLTPQQ